MTTSIFAAVNQHIDLSPELFIQEINSIVPELFTELIDAGFSNSETKSIIIYIVYAYSKESKMLVLGQGYEIQKDKIFKMANLPDYRRSDIVLMKNPCIRKTILEYLESQAHRDFRHLIQKYELYEALCASQLSNIRDEDGEVNYKEMMESSKYIDKLLEDIKKMEADYKIEYKFVELNFEEMQVMDPTIVQTLSIEHNRYVQK